jgi:hypothetical protein
MFWINGLHEQVRRESYRGLMPRCNKVFTIYSKNLFPRLADTLVTLTPSYPLVTFQQKPCFREILLERGIVCPFSEVT